jgi:hypothetical protein
VDAEESAGSAVCTRPIDGMGSSDIFSLPHEGFERTVISVTALTGMLYWLGVFALTYLLYLVIGACAFALWLISRTTRQGGKDDEQRSLPICDRE